MGLLSQTKVNSGLSRTPLTMDPNAPTPSVYKPTVQTQTWELDPNAPAPSVYKKPVSSFAMPKIQPIKLTGLLGNITLPNLKDAIKPITIDTSNKPNVKVDYWDLLNMIPQLAGELVINPAVGAVSSLKEAFTGKPLPKITIPAFGPERGAEFRPESRARGNILDTKSTIQNYQELIDQGVPEEQAYWNSALKTVGDMSVFVPLARDVTKFAVLKNAPELAFKKNITKITKEDIADYVTGRKTNVDVSMPPEAKKALTDIFKNGTREEKVKALGGIDIIDIKPNLFGKIIGVTDEEAKAILDSMGGTVRPSAVAELPGTRPIPGQSPAFGLSLTKVENVGGALSPKATEIVNNGVEKPTLKLKRDVQVTTLSGEKVTIDADEVLKAYESGGKTLLKDGREYIVSKNQYENIKNNSKTNEVKPFAPELAQTEETIKGAKNQEVQKLYAKNDEVIQKTAQEKYGKPFEELTDREQSLLIRNSEAFKADIVDATKYSSYTLPGGQNYKEVLIKAPVEPKGTFTDYVSTYRERFPNSELTDARLKEFYNEGTVVPEKGKFISEPNYFKSSHWDEPNVISHLRLNERTYNGKKVTFMEELQSDWAREGRAKGFASEPAKIEDVAVRWHTPEVPAGHDPKLYPGYWEGYNKISGEVIGRYSGLTETAAMRQAIKEKDVYRIGTKIPNNPLLKNWQELSIKRALKEAVDNGSEYLAWINGEQTAARYNLSKEVKKIDWHEGNDNTKIINIYPKTGKSRINVGVDTKTGEITIADDRSWEGKKLDEVIGKGLAEKITASIEGKLEGEGLNFGGEWANTLYDKQVKNIVEDLTGQKVEVLDMGLATKTEKNPILIKDKDGKLVDLTTDKLKVGEQIYANTDYIITDVLGDGKFKAVPKSDIYDPNYVGTELIKDGTYTKIGNRYYTTDAAKTFDISTKKSPGQQAIKITPEIKAMVEGKSLLAQEPIRVYNREHEYEVPAKGETRVQAVQEVPETADSRRAGGAEATSKGFVDIRGKVAKSIEEVASLLKDFRNPSREILHFVYLADDGKVLAHTALTSNKVAMVAMTNKEFYFKLQDRAKKLGATKIYTAHNHPSGDVEPSQADETMLLKAAKGNDVVKGGIILDHNKATFMTVDKSNKPIVGIKTEEKQIDLGKSYEKSNQTINSVKDLLEVAKTQHAFDEGRVGIFTMSASGKLQDYKTIKLNPEKLDQTIQQFIKESDATNAVIAVTEKDFNKLKPLNVMDIAVSDGKTISSIKASKINPEIFKKSENRFAKNYSSIRLFDKGEEIYKKQVEIENLKEAIANNKAKELSKYVSKKEGEFRDVTGGKVSAMGRKTGIWERFGDRMVGELGYETPEDAMKAYDQYLDQKKRLASLQEDLKSIKTAPEQKPEQPELTDEEIQQSYDEYVQTELGKKEKKPFDQYKREKRERGFVSSIKEDLPNLQRIAGQYIPRDTDELAIMAKNQIKDNIDVAEKMALTETDDKAVATAAELLKYYAETAAATTDKAVQNALYEKAAKIGNTMAEKLTELGRSVQAASILGRLTPEGQVKFAARQIQKYNEGNPRKQIPELSADQAKVIIDEMKAIGEMGDSVEKGMRFQKLQDYVSDLVPTPLFKKIITVWKAGLLTGVKTHAVNILSNLSHGVTEFTKGIPATMVDQIVSLFTGNRTTTLTLKGIGSGLAEGGSKGLRYLRTGYDERNIGTKLDYHRVNFGKGKIARALQMYTNSVFRFLGAQDQPFYYAAKIRSFYEQAKAQAINKGLKGREAQGFIDELVQNPTDEMTKYATIDAETAVFQNKTALGSAAKKIQEVPGAEIIVPFSRTPSAVAMQIINYSPIGIAKTIFENAGKGKFDQRQFAQGIGRGLTGIAVLALGAYLYKKGMLTTARPTSEKEQKLWELEGRQANSIKIGGKWRQVQLLGPAGNVMLIGASFQKAYNETGTLSGAGSQGLADAAQSFTQQTFLTGVSNFIDAVSDPARSANYVLGSTLSSTIPTLVSDTARAIDTKERRANTIFEKFMARIPGVREKLEPQVDVLGKERQVANPLEIMADPTRPLKAGDSPVITELRRLWDAGEKVSPSLLGDKTGFEGLTPEQNTNLWKRAGEIIDDKLGKLFEKTEYKILSNEKKGKTVASFVEKSQIAARTELVLQLTEGLSGDTLKAELSKLKQSGLLTEEVFNNYLKLR